MNMPPEAAADLQRSEWEQMGARLDAMALALEETAQDDTARAEAESARLAHEEWTGVPFQNLGQARREFRGRMDKHAQKAKNAGARKGFKAALRQAS